MKNSTDLGGVIRLSTSVDSTLLDRQNSSYPTQPHSIIITNFMNFLGARHPVWESKCSRRGNPSSTAELQQPYKRAGKVTERKGRAGP